MREFAVGKLRCVKEKQARACTQLDLRFFRVGKHISGHAAFQSNAKLGFYYIGGSMSANTRKLVQAAKEEGVPAYQVERPNELEPGWFTGVERVGLTAGASTPDSVIDDVERRIYAFESEHRVPA